MTDIITINMDNKNNQELSVETPELSAIKNDIMSDVAKVNEQAEQLGAKKFGYLLSFDCNKYAAIAAQQPDAKPLYKELWFEGQLAIFFARDGTGKSVFAMQIAIEIAKQRNVAYFDFEMTISDFKDRYIAEDGTPYPFPNRLKYIAPDYMNLEVKDILFDIENCAKGTQSEVLIIDNITALSCELEEGSEAIKLMQRIKRMAHANRWSIMLVAHTPKLMDGCPIKQTDVAGSKKLTDLAASVFSIGKSIKNDTLRYLIQLKQRHSHNEFYSQDNVLLLRLDKEYNFLCFSEVGTSSEYEELCLNNQKHGTQAHQQKKSVEKIIKNILAGGKEMGLNELGRAIAKAMSGERGWSLTNAKKYVKKESEKGDFLIKNNFEKYCLRSDGQVV